MSRIRLVDLGIVAALTAATTTAWGVADASFALGSDLRVAHVALRSWTIHGWES